MNALNEALVTVHSRIITMAAVPNPSPNFSGPGVGALQAIANVVFALVLILGVIGGLIAGGFIVVGHVSSNGRVQKAGIVGVLSCVAGVAIAGSMAGLINWGQSLHVA